MTISIWRYSHLVLAISSFLLIAVASVTGIILAFEPVIVKNQNYKVDGFNDITLAQAIPTIKKQFEEVTDVTVDVNQFVIVKGIDLNGDNVEAYVDARNGKILGKPGKKSAFFQWVTSFHRSLFLNNTGRFIIGITAFLLLLITVTGIMLIIQRQRGIKRFFTKIVRENFYQYYHVTLGRLLLIPVLLICLTGTVLFMVRFKIIPPAKKIESKVNLDDIKETPEKKFADIDIFKNTHLNDVRSVEFPFSEDVEDYYTLKLNDRELTVNQITGDILTEVPYPFTALLSELSLDLHTGRTNRLWAIVLALASANILFFIYSGFAITLKRIKGNVKNKYKKDECEYIILVGSENGTTNRFAKAVYQHMIKQGKKCFITHLNAYTTFAKAEQLIVMTATYGLGDPPTNANKFLSLIQQHPQPNKVHFSVVGFGSKSYPDFCKFGFDVHNHLTAQPWAIPLTEIHTVNDRSPDEFTQWLDLWGQKNEMQIKLPASILNVNPTNLISFKVTSKSKITSEEGTFLIHLQPKRRTKFKSGDILAIYPANDYRERLYSIGKIDKKVQLSIKLHKYGLGSGYLHQLEAGQVIRAKINKNPHFHFPQKADNVIMICNGTGIAPFLGMINSPKTNGCHLYCGFRDALSFSLYKDFMDESLAAKKLTAVNLALSREGNRQYVNHLVLRDKKLIAEAMSGNGVIMICGSLAMQKDILEVCEQIFSEYKLQQVSHYQAEGRILSDCY